MDQAIQVLIAVIAISVGILVIYQVIGLSNETKNTAYNDNALEILMDRANFACNINTFGGQIAIIEPTSGTIFYTKEHKVCYSYDENTGDNETDRVRCKPISCSVVNATILNLTGEFAKKAYVNHRFKCNIVNEGNLTINCTG